ncbi:MAG: hypothetical protein ACOC46_04685, partial [Pirellulales bacterium]
GVVVPCLIVFGLMAIPYLDRNPKGNGYYTLAERPFAIGAFLFGLLGLWIMLILVGVFLRGPNWTFFATFQPRDPHVLTPQPNVSLAEYFWVVWLGTSLPAAPPDAGIWAQTWTIILRKILGLTLTGLYFAGIPWWLARTRLKRLRRQMGTARYTVMILLLLAMAALPLKMILQWTMNLSYVVCIPELSLSF